MTETKILNFVKNVDGTTVICDKIDGITVISNLARPPNINVHSNCRSFSKQDVSVTIVNPMEEDYRSILLPNTTIYATGSFV